MCDLTNANLMRGAAQVKEAIMHAATATHQHIAGDAGIESARDQRQHIILRANREAANAFITAVDQHQAIVIDLKVDRFLRMVKLNRCALDMLIQAATNITLNILRAKIMLAASFNAHAERFTFDAAAV